ncbi:MAG: hypothetical protein K5664_00940 [Firmicutes bacterium]|nr:hypothetical protein [Bacillota bacterium]
MITRNFVTIWHDGKRCVFPVLSIKICSSIDKNGIKQKGFFDSSVCLLRIPANTELDISIGDFVRPGKYSGMPDREADFKVMKISNNLRGTTPHYKLVCEK